MSIFHAPVFLPEQYVFVCLFHPSGNSVAAPQARKREDDKKIRKDYTVLKKIGFKQ